MTAFESSCGTPNAFVSACPLLTWKAPPTNATYQPLPLQTPCKKSAQACMPEPAQTTQPTVKSEDTAEGVIRNFWEIIATGEFTKTARLFTEDAIYNDTLYKEPFKGMSQISTHLKNMESAFPPALVFILDSVAAAESSLTVGARWHAETDSGQLVPLTRGASMYTLRKVNRPDGSVELLIEDAWDFPETPLKVAAIVLPVLRFASSVIRLIK